MLTVITQGSHPEFLSPQGCSPVWNILAEGLVQSLTEVSDLRSRSCVGESSCKADQGGVSGCAYHSIALGLCLYTVQWASWGSRTVFGYLEWVMSLDSGFQAQWGSWLSYFCMSKGIVFIMLIVGWFLIHTCLPVINK